jgi:hypothetical protein
MKDQSGRGISSMTLDARGKNSDKKASVGTSSGTSFLYGPVLNPFLGFAGGREQKPGTVVLRKRGGCKQTIQQSQIPTEESFRRRIEKVVFDAYLFFPFSFRPLFFHSCVCFFRYLLFFFEGGPRRGSERTQSEPRSRSLYGESEQIVPSDAFFVRRRWQFLLPLVRRLHPPWRCHSKVRTAKQKRDVREDRSESS